MIYAPERGTHPAAPAAHDQPPRGVHPKPTLPSPSPTLWATALGVKGEGTKAQDEALGTLEHRSRREDRAGADRQGNLRGKDKGALPPRAIVTQVPRERDFTPHPRGVGISCCHLLHFLPLLPAQVLWTHKEPWPKLPKAELPPAALQERGGWGTGTCHPVLLGILESGLAQF